jgi:DUF177 domain-containing protein
MLIKVKDLELRKLEFNESLAPGTIDFGDDLVQTAPLAASGQAELIRENRGGRNVVEDIRVVGSFATEIDALCARCLEPVHNAVKEKFDLLYRPLGIDARSAEVSISQAETEIGYYQGAGVLLEDVLKEQILLALPVKQVCRANCKGLCPQCGKNLNVESCDCVNSMPDPRWLALEDIRKKLER